MAAANYNITIDQGSDFEISVILQTEDGVVEDLTGYSARAQLRQTKSAVSVAATFTCNILDPETGEITMFLGNAVTELLIASTTAGKYYYDLEIYTAADAIVRRVLQGEALVTEEVTR